MRNIRYVIHENDISINEKSAPNTAPNIIIKQDDTNEFDAEKKLVAHGARAISFLPRRVVRLIKIQNAPADGV